MLSRSSSTFLAGCAILFPAAALAGDATHGTFDNTQQAKQLFSSAYPLQGSFKITSKGGMVLTFQHDQHGPNFYPSDDPLEKILKAIENIPDSTAYQTIDLETNSDDNTVRLSAGSKCISAQWSDSDGFDMFAVAYECGVGSNADKSSTVRDAKQWYILQPATSSSSSGNSSHGKMSKSHKRHHHHISRRDDTPEWFKIVLTDHIEDQAARCMTAVAATAYGDAQSSSIKQCVDGDEDQLWTFQQVQGDSGSDSDNN